MPLSTSSIPAPGLDHLLSLATPTDTIRGMFFNGLLEATHALGGEEVRLKCLTAAGERKFVDFRSYPVADLLRAVYTATELLGPKLGGRDAVLHQLGRRATEDFVHSTVGKTMVALAGNDVYRLLAAFPNACRAALSYGERSMERLGDKRVRMLVRGDLMPMQYTAGSLTAVVERSGVPGFTVRPHRLSAVDVDYDISWS